jgi:hypothetical protein
MTGRPLARSAGLLTEPIGDVELVVYDSDARIAPSLSGSVKQVWERCDGQRTVKQISAETRLEPELVNRAVAELSACGLLDDGPEADGLSRREMARRFAGVTAAAFAAPLIYSVAVPASAAAGSTCTAPGLTCAGLYSDSSCTILAEELEPCAGTGCTCQNTSCTYDNGFYDLHGTCA